MKSSAVVRGSDEKGTEKSMSENLELRLPAVARKLWLVANKLRSVKMDPADRISSFLNVRPAKPLSLKNSFGVLTGPTRL